MDIGRQYNIAITILGVNPIVKKVYKFKELLEIRTNNITIMCTTINSGTTFCALINA